MRASGKAAAVLAVFAGVGWLAARAVAMHAHGAGAMQPEVRLAAAMAGLFAGGAAAVLVGIALLRWR